MAQMIATCSQTRESAAGVRQPVVCAVSPAQPREEALRNLGSAVRGASETLRLGPGERPLPSTAPFRLSGTD